MIWLKYAITGCVIVAFWFWQYFQSKIINTFQPKKKKNLWKSKIFVLTFIGPVDCIQNDRLGLTINMLVTVFNIFFKNPWIWKSKNLWLDTRKSDVQVVTSAPLHKCTAPINSCTETTGDQPIKMREKKYFWFSISDGRIFLLNISLNNCYGG